MIQKIKKIGKILINYKEPKQALSANQNMQYHRVKPWFEINGDETLRLNYNLNETSVVFDLGGYKGEFTSDIYCKYGAIIYIFEPIKDFYDVIKNKFLYNQKIIPFQFGLSNKDQEIEISLSDNSSSIYIKTEFTETIILKSIVDFITQNKITKVDLIKINIEGGEYELLESLLKNNLIHIFINIQVQFHDFIIENAKERMSAIQLELAKTHELTYQYEFVWENWKLKQ